MQSAWAVGYLLAAILAAAVLPGHGWRPLFVPGLLPAAATLWMRRGIGEPSAWRPHAHRITGAVAALFRAPLRRTVLVVSALCSSVLFGYWGLFTWLPAYLSTPVERGGAGLSVLQSSGWIVPLQVGAFAGYVTFGFFADRFGRRPAFLVFVLATAVLAPVYGLMGRRTTLLLALGPLPGYFGHGYYSVLGAMMAELFPQAVRTTAQGFCYNIGRALAGLAPVTVGALGDRYGIGAAMGTTAVCFAAGSGFMLLLPETRGRELAGQ
jgi:MFS family permease